jgi:hypothetical protein
MLARSTGRTLQIVGFLLVAWSPLAGQAVLTGLVREDATGRVLSGVEILVEGSSLIAVSDQAGEYAFQSVPRGAQVVLFRSVGFRPIRIRVELGEGGVARLDAILVPFAVQLDPLVTSTEVKQPKGMGREAFEERRNMGFGKFIDSLELRRSEDRRLSDLLRRHNGVVIAQNRYAMSTRTGCFMQVIYDEQSVYSPAAYTPSAIAAAPATGPAGATSRSTRTARPLPPSNLFDINTFSVSNLEAVEIYRSLSDTPLQFGGASAGCGTLVLWSRRGGPPRP